MTFVVSYSSFPNIPRRDAETQRKESANYANVNEWFLGGLGTRDQGLGVVVRKLYVLIRDIRCFPISHSSFVIPHSLFATILSAYVLHPSAALYAATLSAGTLMTRLEWVFIKVLLSTNVGGDIA